jgi:hypothetical protein
MPNGFNLDQQIAENIASGMAPDEARFRGTTRVWESRCVARAIHGHVEVESTRIRRSTFPSPHECQCRWCVAPRRLRPALLGLAMGLAGSIGASQLIRSMLYGTQPAPVKTR